mmetsp:Transcript_6704/g.14434  ORF Transcript_6704/g.14434 Transcript_6704/m.14434 type:complete len:271 (-) Transcript_6704:149-961(-)
MALQVKNFDGRGIVRSKIVRHHIRLARTETHVLHSFRHKPHDALIPLPTPQPHALRMHGSQIRPPRTPRHVIVAPVHPLRPLPAPIVVHDRPRRIVPVNYRILPLPHHEHVPLALVLQPRRGVHRIRCLLRFGGNERGFDLSQSADVIVGDDAEPVILIHGVVVDGLEGVAGVLRSGVLDEGEAEGLGGRRGLGHDDAVPAFGEGAHPGENFGDDAFQFVIFGGVDFGEVHHQDGAVERLVEGGVLGFDLEAGVREIVGHGPDIFVLVIG